MGETEFHLRNIFTLIGTLECRHAHEPLVYVWGDMFIYYVEGDKRKHVSPDVFFVRGVPKRVRDCYFLWKEGKSPDCIIEITSKSTRKEDTKVKFELYRDVLKVPEYFLFDPREEYLRPSLQGFRLQNGIYEPIAGVDGRLPSEAMQLHLERDGTELRLYDPVTQQRLLTPAEEATRFAAENEQLRREIEELRAQKGKP